MGFTHTGAKSVRTSYGQFSNNPARSLEDPVPSQAPISIRITVRLRLVRRRHNRPSLHSTHDRLRQRYAANLQSMDRQLTNILHQHDLSSKLAENPERSMVNTIPSDLQSERTSKRHQPQTQPEQCIPRSLPQQHLPNLVRKGHNTQPNPKPDTCQRLLHLQILRMAQLNRSNNPEPNDG